MQYTPEQIRELIAENNRVNSLPRRSSNPTASASREQAAAETIRKQKTTAATNDIGEYAENFWKERERR